MTGKQKGPQKKKPEFLLPFAGRIGKHRPTKFTIADDATMRKILASHTPEFKGEEYVPGGEEIKDKLTFKCEEPNCGARYPSQVQLLRHRKKHLDKSLICEHCHMTLFRTKEELAKHLTNFHFPEGNPFKCRQCGLVCRDMVCFKKHITRNHTGKLYPCPNCGFKFKQEDGLKQHLRQTCGPGQGLKHPCEICDKVYSHKTTLRKHILDVHRGGKDILRCVICDTFYGGIQSYKRHMNLHTNPPQFHYCKVCKAQFASRGKLREHLEKSMKHKENVKKARVAGGDIEISTLTKRKTPNSKSNEVPVPAPTPEELIHMCKTQPVKVLLHRVDHRARKFSTVLVVPQKINRSYLGCLYCEKSFGTLEAVLEHEPKCFKYKISQKIFKCEICDKEFKQKCHLRNHMQTTHSEERPFKCSYCDARFKSTDVQFNHEQRIHFGISKERMLRESQPEESRRKFRCNHDGCGREYRSAKSLRRHVEGFHLGIKYKCEICGMETVRKDQYKTHMKRMHSDNPTLLLCKPCKRTYKERRSFLMHLETPRHKRKVLETKRGRRETVDLSFRTSFRRTRKEKIHAEVTSNSDSDPSAPPSPSISRDDGSCEDNEK